MALIITDDKRIGPHLVVDFSDEMSVDDIYPMAVLVDPEVLALDPVRVGLGLAEAQGNHFTALMKSLGWTFPCVARRIRVMVGQSGWALPAQIREIVETFLSIRSARWLIDMPSRRRYSGSVMCPIYTIPPFKDKQIFLVAKATPGVYKEAWIEAHMTEWIRYV